jgi:hypothetical protein
MSGIGRGHGIKGQHTNGAGAPPVIGVLGAQACNVQGHILRAERAFARVNNSPTGKIKRAPQGIGTKGGAIQQAIGLDLINSETVAIRFVAQDRNSNTQGTLDD